ncbi:hypothetical protein SEA_HONK_32 [Microbacterium phage Honk]|uniref:Uncharacterized protein n=1 Tax=Microbacterium phage Honk TaxID=2836095 RepID=A0A8F3E8A3_9CAUD|nr:hypothetical protein SEA_HONK_32 [Microbacterium phage Honk]
MAVSPHMNTLTLKATEAPAFLAFTNRASYRRARQEATRRVRRLERHLFRVEGALDKPERFPGHHTTLRARRIAITRTLTSAHELVAEVDAAPRGYGIPEEVAA